MARQTSQTEFDRPGAPSVENADAGLNSNHRRVLEAPRRWFSRWAPGRPLAVEKQLASFAVNSSRLISGARRGGQQMPAPPTPLTGRPGVAGATDDGG